MKKKNRSKRRKKIIYILMAVVLLLFTVAMYFISNFFVDRFQQPKLEQSISNANLYGNTILIDMENDNYLINGSSTFTNQYALSGSYSSIMPGKDTYSASVLLDILETDSTYLSEAGIECWLLPNNESIDAVLVFSIVDSTETNTLYWDGYKINGDNFTAKTWQQFSHNFKIPGKYLNLNNKFKVYIWNINKNDDALYADDISIKFNQPINKGKPRTLLIDYENIKDGIVSNKMSNSGNFSAIVNGKDSYTVSHTQALSTFDIDNFDRLNYRYYYYSETANIDFVLVIEITDSNGEILHWHGDQVNTDNAQQGKWTKMLGMIVIPSELIKPENKIRVYGWNRNENTVYIDDIYLILKTTSDIRTGDKSFCDLVNDPVFTHKTNFPPYRNFNFYFSNDCTTPFSNISIDFWQQKYFCTGNFVGNNYDEIIFCKPENNIEFFVYNQSFEKYELNIKAHENQIYIPLKLNSENDFLLIFDNSKETISIYQIEINGNKALAKQNQVFEYKDLKINPPVYSATSLPANNKNIPQIVVSSFNQILSFSFESGVFTKRKVIKQYNKHFNSKMYSGNFTGNSNQELFILSDLDEKCNIELVDFNNQQNPVEINRNKNCKQGYDSLKTQDIFIKGNFDSDITTSLLKLDRSWRFDLKMIEINSIGYDIKSQVSFLNYPNQYNPMFFTETFFIGANLYGNDKYELIVFLSNRNSISRSSLNNNNLSRLPNKIAIYETE
ncbi:MAG: hypothetical protein RBR64_07015 [Bacteroidales bacterium]|jgi:hypothetical protein|nr:hypothetical protein [Bacteroidales bacterium]